MTQEHLTQRQAASYLGVSVSTLANRRSNGLPPRSWLSVAHRVMYSRSDLDAFVRDHAVATTRGHQ